MPNALSPKKVIRGHITKTLKHGWRNALKEKGYDEVGKRLDGSGGLSLRGSLKVLVWNDVLPLIHDKEMVKNDIAKMAREIIDYCQKRDEANNQR